MNPIWEPYEQRTHRKPDFLVKYRFLDEDEGGRSSLPFQGYRSDIFYEGGDLQKDGIYAVWPEFLDTSLQVITDANTQVPTTGHAYMWIAFFDEMWQFHQKQAQPSKHGWFMEGSRKIASFTVVEQIGLTHTINQLG